MSSINPMGTLPTIGVGSDGHVTATGLVNNLDTTAIVNALMTAAAVPQQQVQNRLTTEQATLATYQNLNQSLQTLATSAAADSATNGLNLLDVSSTDPSVTGTASTSANATRLSLEVDRVAQAQISVTEPMTAWPDGTGTVTIVGSDGSAHQITASGSSPSDIAAAVNKAGLGVSAATVAVGAAGDGTPQYRIQFTSTATGADAAFQVFAGADQAGPRVDDVTVLSAQDAQVTLWPGTAAAQSVTSTSNTFNDIQSGMTVTVSQQTSAPVTVTSALNGSAVEQAASTLVDAVTSILGFLSANTAAAVSTDQNGNATVTPGAFTGDYSVSQIRTSLTNAVMNPVGADGLTSPGSLGISMGQDGSLSFDTAAFQAALASDPGGTVAAVQQIAARVQQVAAGASDPASGTITADITTQKTLIGNDQASIDQWTTLLAAKKTMLQSQYANLVTMLGQLQSQQQYLQQQIDALGNNSKN